MDVLHPERFIVPVPGGDLLVARWGSGGPVVVAAHGVTATHMCWPLIAQHLDGAVTLVAPDLRGRGGSNRITGPFGIARHADDLVAVLDHLGVERAVAFGQSMGGFVAAAMAVRHPERVDGVVLADGGIKLMDIPQGVDIDALLEQIIGPSLQRLRMTFPSRDAYRDFWRQHPGLAGAWSPFIEAYVDYDLVGEEPELRSGVSLDAVRRDSADTLADAETLEAIERITHPTTFIRAERGVLDEPTPLYPDERVAQMRETIPQLEDVSLPGTNHFTMILSDAGAAPIAEQIRKAAGA